VDVPPSTETIALANPERASEPPAETLTGVLYQPFDPFGDEGVTRRLAVGAVISFFQVVDPLAVNPLVEART
jgi:hypothetical protein